MVALNAAALPAPLKSNYPDLEKVGESKYYFFFLHVYDIELYQTKNSDYLHALEITYNRDITAERRIEKAVEDIQDQGNFDKKTLDIWKSQMEQIFPNVKDGETITVFQNESAGTEFFHNDNFRGEIADPKFTKAFMSIWLGENPASSGIKYDLMKNALHEYQQ